MMLEGWNFQVGTFDGREDSACNGIDCRGIFNMYSEDLFQKEFHNLLR